MIPKMILSIRNSVCKYLLRLNNNVDIDLETKVLYSKIHILNNSTLQISEHSIVEATISFEKDESHVSIGTNSFIGTSHLVCSKKITIGNNVLVSWGCTIIDHNSHALAYSLRENDVRDWFYGKKDWSTVVSEEINICDKAWIGFNSIILKGVTVGEGAIVGAGSIVTADVPPWTIVAGNPAKVIRQLAADER